MFKIKKIVKNKFFLIIISILSVLSILIFVGLWSIVSDGYDRQNKVILFLKEIIPTNISRKVRDTIFIIPDSKEQNRIQNLQAQKHEQGLEGKIFNDITVVSKKNKKQYLLKEFFLPFPRLDLRLGWAATKNSRRAHYLEIVGDKVLVISGLGQTIYFDKKNIFNKKLKQKEISNNIQDILTKNNYELIGIRDLYVEGTDVYISLQHKSSKGFSINVYKSDLNFEKLNFKLFFETNEYWPTYNVFSGGRLEKFRDNKILFSIGYSYIKLAAQNKNSFLGKIISIDKDTKEYELVSMGHRNPQGLFYVKDLDLIINTEHGPKGGDEINFNFQNHKETPNYGWDVSSYGVEYDGTRYKDSHSKYGFIEPFRYYTPAIGISELIYLPNELSPDGKKHLFVSSLRAGSIYVIKLNDEFNEILDEDRIYFSQQRIRDIDYDQENNVFFLLFEFTPSIGILKIKD